RLRPCAARQRPIVLTPAVELRSCRQRGAHYQRMRGTKEGTSMKRFWIMLAIILTFGFTILGWIGSRIYQEMPPIPERIVTSDGQVVAPEGSIHSGQAVWQTLGGMEVGSIWGHGSYVAPDWSADWLHRECELILDDWARSEHARPYADLGAEPQAALRERLRLMLRANRYDPATSTL